MQKQSYSGLRLILRKAAQYEPTDEPLYPSPPPLPQTAMVSNPLVAGMQLGMMGAASGLGYAAIHRAIRTQAGNAVPVHVLRPILIGATIGSTLGVVGSMTTGRKIMKPSPTSWYDLADTIHRDMYGFPKYKNASAYSGLRYVVMEKKAVLPLAAAALPLVGKGLMAALMGVGLWHAGKGTVKGMGQLAQGQGTAGLKSLGGAGMNALFSVPFLGTAGRALQATKLLRAGKVVDPLTRGPSMLSKFKGWATGVPATGIRPPKASGQVLAAGHNALAGMKPFQGLSQETVESLARAGRGLKHISGNKTLNMAAMGALGYQGVKAFNAAQNPIPLPRRTPFSRLGNILAKIPEQPMPDMASRLEGRRFI